MADYCSDFGRTRSFDCANFSRYPIKVALFCYVQNKPYPSLREVSDRSRYKYDRPLFHELEQKC